MRLTPALAFTVAQSPQVRIKVVYSGIGPVTHSDVQLAAAADASILAFNVKSAAPAVEAEAKQCAVTTCAQVMTLDHEIY